jgi:hypothetical protein
MMTVASAGSRRSQRRQVLPDDDPASKFIIVPNCSVPGRPDTRHPSSKAQAYPPEHQSPVPALEGD